MHHLHYERKQIYFILKGFAQQNDLAYFEKLSTGKRLSEKYLFPYKIVFQISK